jgi:hypothetical protein
MSIAHYHDGFVSSSSTVYGDNGVYKSFTFTLPSDQEGFVGVDLYDPRMYPKGCYTGSSAYIKLMKGTTVVEDRSVSAGEYFGTLTGTLYKAGTYTAYVKASYGANEANDFNFRLYFPSSITITRKDFSTDADATAEMNPPGLVSEKLTTYLNNLVASNVATPNTYGTV